MTTPLLKFVAEFVLNKAQRLTFDISSPNGILLFREVSKLLVAYGSRILTYPNVADIYGSKYKGIWISLTILARGNCLRPHTLKCQIYFVHYILSPVMTDLSMVSTLLCSTHSSHLTLYEPFNCSTFWKLCQFRCV